MNDINFLVLRNDDMGLVFIYPHVGKNEIPSVKDGYLIVDLKKANIINLLIDINDPAFGPTRSRRIAKAFELAAEIADGKNICETCGYVTHHVIDGVCTDCREESRRNEWLKSGKGG